MTNYVLNRSSAYLYVYVDADESEVKRLTDIIRKELPPNNVSRALRHDLDPPILLGFETIDPGKQYRWTPGDRTMYITILLNGSNSTLCDSARFLCDTLPNPARNSFIVDIDQQLSSTTEESSRIAPRPNHNPHQPSTRRLSNAAPNDIYYYASDDRTDVSRQTEKIRWRLPPHKPDNALQNFPDIATRFGFVCLHSGKETLIRGLYITIMIQNGYGAPVRRLCDAHPIQSERIRVTGDSKINWH